VGNPAGLSKRSVISTASPPNAATIMIGERAADFARSKISLVA
jgi:hypothetical protein